MGSKVRAYSTVFSWSKEGVDDSQYIRVGYPNTIFRIKSPGWIMRDKFCCIIAGNKSFSQNPRFNLYRERIKIVKWFEENAPQDLDLYGTGWNLPPKRHGLAGRVINKFFSKLYANSKKVFFPLYRGTVANKIEIMSQYRYCICYENIREPGYITEKIFDCFVAGCIPVYWGAQDITKYIPANCFIDRQAFSSHKDLYEFMVNMTQDEYTAYQERILAFLNSELAKVHSAESFAEVVVNKVASDLLGCPVRHMVYQ
jgi:hypothetical protein